MKRSCSTLVFILVSGVTSALAQNSAGFTDPAIPINPPPKSQNASRYTPSTSKTESSLFYFLNMAGRTQKDFQPLTAREKLKFAVRGAFGPVAFFTASVSSSITQWRNVPSEWGQGAEGFGDRFGNYYGKQLIYRGVRLAGEDLLHEDNRYYGSGEHGFGRRIGYALKSSVMARDDNGTQHISISGIGGLAASAFISRLWQPPTTSSMADGATSFGISLGTNAGIDVLREFLPDVTRHVFHHNESPQH